MRDHHDQIRTPFDPGTPVPGRAEAPEQKAEVLRRLGELWAKHPDMRLGQLIGNVYHSTDYGGCKLYYTEDFELIGELEKTYSLLE